MNRMNKDDLKNLTDAREKKMEEKNLIPPKIQFFMEQSVFLEEGWYKNYELQDILDFMEERCSRPSAED